MEVLIFKFLPRITAAIKNSLSKAKNKNFETYEFEGMNHLFQECKTDFLRIWRN
jgi:hypothetical protein